MKVQNILLIFFLSVIILESCNQKQSKIEEAKAKIEYIEQQKKTITTKDWAELDTLMNKLELNNNTRDNYAEEQVKLIGNLQGRYAALLVKKELKNFKKSLKDLGNQIEGFVDGLVDSTNNK